MFTGQSSGMTTFSVGGSKPMKGKPEAPELKADTKKFMVMNHMGQ
jgi:hypothetical protein